MKTKDMLDTHDKVDHKIYFMYVERNQGDNWHSEQGGHNTHLSLVEEILLKQGHDVNYVIDGTEREWDQARMTQEQGGKNKEQ
jgi:hypothetical protein